MKRYQSLSGKLVPLALLLAVLVIAPPLSMDTQAKASPPTIHVPSDCPTIEAAMDATSPGDTIIIRGEAYTKPDLVATDIWIKPAEFYSGDTVRIYNNFTNIGGGDAEGCFTVKYYFDTAWASFRKEGLYAGISYIFYYDYTWPLDINSHTLKLIVDADKNITESNETNNNLSKSFTALPTSLEGRVSFGGRGLAPSSRWIEPFVVKLFEPGNLDNVLWEGTATTNSSGYFTITGLIPGTYDIGIKNATCLSELETGVVLSGAITVVDFGTTREGDIITSDKVDIADVSALSGAYNSRPGDPNWNPNADLNRSGKVDGFDVSALSYSYGVRGAAAGHF